MGVIVSGRRKWKSDTRKEKRKLTQLSRLLIPLFISALHSPPSFIFLRLSLLFMVELYNSERVSIARGSALRSPVLSVQYLHGSRRSQKGEIYQFLSSLRGASLRSTDEIITVLRWRAPRPLCIATRKSAIRDAAGSRKRTGTGHCVSIRNEVP